MAWCNCSWCHRVLISKLIDMACLTLNLSCMTPIWPAYDPIPPTGVYPWRDATCLTIAPTVWGRDLQSLPLSLLRISQAFEGDMVDQAHIQILEIDISFFYFFIILFVLYIFCGDDTWYAELNLDSNCQGAWSLQKIENCCSLPENEQRVDFCFNFLLKYMFHVNQRLFLFTGNEHWSSHIIHILNWIDNLDSWYISK